MIDWCFKPDPWLSTGKKCEFEMVPQTNDGSTALGSKTYGSAAAKIKNFELVYSVMVNLYYHGIHLVIAAKLPFWKDIFWNMFQPS